LGYFVSPGAREVILSLRKKNFMEEELPDFFHQLKTLGIPFAEIEKMYREYLL
jgi:DNA-binding transcriptional regulator YhcF (GntR family)